MELKDIKAVYFVGAGGIGMSAIARYFLKKGIVVAGYDKVNISSDSFVKQRVCGVWAAGIDSLSCRLLNPRKQLPFFLAASKQAVFPCMGVDSANSNFRLFESGSCQ